MSAPPPLGWGVLGAAWVAERAVLPAIAAAGGRVVVVASRRADRARRLAAAYPGARAALAYDDVLTDPRVDAVYIPLPNRLHEPWTIAAAARGKHVLCEKPLADGPAAAGRMVTACAAAGVVLAEAVMFRYHPRMARLAALLAGGAVGALVELEAAFAFPLDPEPNIRWSAALGGGALLDVGSYGVHAARWLMAAEPERVAAVLQPAAEAAPSSGEAVDLGGAAVLGFGGRRTATVAFSFRGAEHQRLTLVGTEGVLTVPRPFTAWTGERLPFALWVGGRARAIPTPAADPYRLMVEAFTRAVRTGEPVPTSGRNGVGTVAVIDRCRRAAGWGAGGAPVSGA